MTTLTHVRADRDAHRSPGKGINEDDGYLAMIF
jgi:hypothetical protein